MLIKEIRSNLPFLLEESHNGGENAMSFLHLQISLSCTQAPSWLFPEIKVSLYEFLEKTSTVRDLLAESQVGIAEIITLIEK